MVIVVVTVFDDALRVVQLLIEDALIVQITHAHELLLQQCHLVTKVTDLFLILLQPTPHLSSTKLVLLLHLKHKITSNKEHINLSQFNY